MCPGGREDYIPCYNVTASLEAGYSDGLEFEAHCELTGKTVCLVPPPKDYRILQKWPVSSQGIWRGNVRIDEAVAANRYAHQYEEDRIVDEYDGKKGARVVGESKQFCLSK